MLPKLAWKNLWRRRRRTLITMSSIAFGVWFACTFLGVRNHSYTSLIEGSVRLGAGHLSVQPAGYNLAPGLDKKLSGVKISDLEDATIIGRLAGPAMFATSAGSAPGLLLGIDPALERAELNAYLGAIEEGRSFSATNGRGAIIGAVLAERLKLRLGSKLIYTAVDARGEMISETARVEAIFKTGVDDADGGTVLLPIDTLRAALGFGSEDISIAAIYLEDHRRAAATARILREKNIPGTEVLTWQDTQPGVAAYIALAEYRTDVFLVLIVLVIAAGVLNTLLMSVLERKKELGVMLAIGTSPSRLFRLVVCEAAFLALIGFGAGIAAFFPWKIYMQRVGLDMSHAIGTNMQISGALYDPILRIALRSEDAVAVFSGLFVLVLATAAYPALRAARLPPLESMKST